MSKDTQNTFIQRIKETEPLFYADFKIKHKKIAVDGLVTRISYSFGRGIVEFLLGPPEYHVEIFISTINVDGNFDRYDLAKLMSISRLRTWIINNKPDINCNDKIKAEIDWYVLLLKEIKGLDKFRSLST